MARSLFIILAAMVALQPPQKPTFRSAIDLVHFGVVVTDTSGMPITGLKPEDFEIVEEGKKQTITQFAGGDPASAPALHLGFMIDLSGSMSEDIRDVRTAAIKFLDSVRRVEDITVVDFDTQINIAHFAGDDPRLVEFIRAKKPNAGWTAFYDAVGVYLNKAVEQMGDKILVMYTDGGDTRSAINQGELITLLKASDVTVYSIGYLEHQGSGRHEQQQTLQRLSHTTGGQAFFPTNMKDVDKFYAKIVAEIAARYSLGYVSTNTKKDGKWRDVKVRLLRQDLKDAKVRTRPGYYAVYQPGS
jgi:Ca-activated chloride channel homolog